MKKQIFVSFFLLSLIFISFLSILPTVETLDNESLLSINKPIIQTTDNFKVIWFLVQEQPYIINISIQNLKLEKQDMNITSIFSDLININDLTVTGFYEWKNVTIINEEPIYNITQTTSNNGTVLTSTEIIGYETKTTYSLKWKRCKTRLFTKNKKDLKISYGFINIPKLFSKQKDGTINGTKLFKIEFKTKMEKLNYGWGSKGTIALKINNDVFDPSWLTSWGYRKSHIIICSEGAGTNYQINSTVYYGSGSDSYENVYLNENCQPDFDDIRLANLTSDLYDFWIESKINSDVAKFWYEVTDDLSTTNATVYIYYGNPDVSTTSNGELTFPLFDHFLGSSLNTTKWNYVATPWVDSSHVTLAGTTSEAISSKVTFGIGYAIRGWGTLDDKGNFGASIIGFNVYIGQIDAVCISSYRKTPLPNEDLFAYSHKDSSGSSIATGDLESSDYKMFNIMRASTDLNQYKVDDFDIVEITTNIPENNLGLKLFMRFVPDLTRFDWVLVRKYVYPEPLNYSWGTEQTEELPYVTFYNQSNSIFMVNGTKMNNGTQIVYDNNTIIELQGIINISTQFIKFDWTTNKAETNPYIFTVNENTTIWLMVNSISEYEPPIAVFPLIESILVLDFIIIGIGLCGFWYPLLNWIALILSFLCLIPMPTNNAFIRNFTVGTVALNVIMTLLNTIRRLRE